MTDVEKHLPDLAEWIAPFRLAPDWRLDDLMISYAPEGASVGAHVDEYDVFLLQASGTRRWSIARPGEETADDLSSSAPSGTSAPRPPPPDAFVPVREHRTVAGGDLALLAAFEPTDCWNLVPGDVLYLPPGVPHHGVAVGEDCTTWSIGFRSPSAAEAFLHVAERVAGRLPHARLRDGGAGRGEPGRIDARTVAAVKALWERATRLDEAAFVELTGRLLTRGGESVPADGEPLEGTDGEAANEAIGDHGASEDLAGGSSAGRRYRPSPFSRLAWSAETDGEVSSGRALLFVDGDCLPCSRGFARQVCDPHGAPLHPPAAATSAASPGNLGDPGKPAASDADDVAAFNALLERGVLIRHDAG